MMVCSRCRDQPLDGEAGVLRQNHFDCHSLDYLLSGKSIILGSHRSLEVQSSRRVATSSLSLLLQALSPCPIQSTSQALSRLKLWSQLQLETPRGRTRAPKCVQQPVRSRTWLLLQMSRPQAPADHGDDHGRGHRLLIESRGGLISSYTHRRLLLLNITDSTNTQSQNSRPWHVKYSRAPSYTNPGPGNPGDTESPWHSLTGNDHN